MGAMQRLRRIFHGASVAQKISQSELASSREIVEEAPGEEKSEPGGRAQWSSQTEFLLTCVGYSVGLGNVWRFPYLCYKSGGGAFMIPYILMIFLIGMPLLFMEYAFGQYFGVGSLTIFKKVCPMFQGIGIGYVTMNTLVAIYYNVIIGLSLYYLFASFTSDLPWSRCGNEWNTASCFDKQFKEDTGFNCSGSNFTFANMSLSEGPCLNWTSANITENMTRTSPSDEYFRLAVMDVSKDHSIENVGHIRWHVCLCLILAWILVVLFVSRGIKSTGKVAYFTATFPYVMLTVLVVRGVTLKGAQNGILYFITPDWEQLTRPDVWFGAATQLFYSTNLAWGGMITMASYNPLNHNCFRDSIVINIVSYFTSLYAGFAVFSIIGYMANEYKVDIKDVIDSGPALAFIVYPRALSLMPLAPMWSALFFFMLFLLGIGSQMVLIETVVTGFVDEFPMFGLNAYIRFSTTVVVAIILFFAGLACTTQGGMYVLSLMDWYAAGFCVMVIAVFECVVINWVYGHKRFASHVKEMLGFVPNLWYRICWLVISPLIILGILIFSFVQYKPAEYGTYLYPGWADAIGWCMALASVVPIFVLAIYKFVTAEGTTMAEKWAFATKPAISIEDLKASKPFNIQQLLPTIKVTDGNSDVIVTSSPNIDTTRV